MTIQTKHYIDLSDIVGLRFECKGCGTTLTVSLKDRVMGRIEKCPSCYQPWAMLNGSSFEQLFEKLRESIVNLERVVAGQTAIPLGLRFSLEIKTGAVPGKD